MKIAVVASSYVPSNAANSIQVMKVCQALQQAGTEVELWVPALPEQNAGEDADWPFLTNFYGITTRFPVHWIPEDLRLKRYDFTWKAIHEIRHQGADVIYTWMAQMAYLSLLYRYPTALELHMMPSGKLGPWILKQVVQTRGDKLFLPITVALREKLDAKFGIRMPDTQVQIAPMGSEPERYGDMPDAAACREQLGLDNVLTAVYTGHLYPGRGMDLLLELAKGFPLVQFLWIGGRESDVGTWRERIQSAGIRNIRLTGFVKNAQLPLYQAAGDILLMPYGKNVGISGAGDTADVCSPMKLFDYLSAGRTILTSDLPVIHEVLTTQNARFAIPDDVSSWKSELQYLIDHPDLRTQLSAQAKEDAGQYTWLIRAQRTVDYFSRMRSDA